MADVSKAMRTVPGLLLLFLLSFFQPMARGQVIPALKAPAHLNAFGTFTYADSGWNGKTIYGYTLGGNWQTAHLLGFEARGSALTFGSTEHQYSALGGARAVYHLSRFTPYAVVLGGVAHARWHGIVNGHLDTEANVGQIGAEWSVLGGVDWYAHHRLSIRVAEFSYSKIYVSPQLSPWSISSGIVYRLR
ncbi:MAG TPA: hypothetical protein VHX11_11550 [Acidobacteriaceae bacterium]|jgi:hypothetical protein|nr:hypothetical protein [Acidobacteriaceae bacterium]